MSVLLIMLPIALILAAVFVAFFVRSVMGGQYDDLDTPPVRMLFDDDVPASRDERVSPASRPPSSTRGA